MTFSERIQLVHEISRSSIATVWEGYDVSLDRKVLVKELHPQFARDEDLRQRFEREARAVASLAHPNIVQIYEFHAEDEKIFLVMEFVDGWTLRQLLSERGIFSPEVAVAIAADILKGLSAAHEKGIIHRDLKPANVMLSERGEVKITDFGLAFVKDLPRLTIEGGFVGTPNYMAPEQIISGEIAPQMDLFSLGAMLFEMLTGKMLIEGSAEVALQELMNFQLPRFSDYRERITPELQRVFVRLLEPKPSKRFESADVALQALEASTEDTLTITPELLREFVEKPSEGERPDFPSLPLQRVRYGRWLAFGGFPILLIVIVFIILQLVENPLQPKKPETPKDTVAIQDTVVPPLEIPKDTSSAPEDTTVAEFIPPEIEKKPPSEVKPPEDTVTVSVVDTSKPAMPQEPAQLRILCEPWAEVIVGGRKIGTTPIEEAIELPAGLHLVIFINKDFPVAVDTNVVLEAGKETVLMVNMYDYVGVIRVRSVKPWADIFLDDVRVGSTPIHKPFLVTLNEKHTIRLVNPDFQPWEKHVLFTHADTLEVRVDFTAPP